MKEKSEKYALQENPYRKGIITTRLRRTPDLFTILMKILDIIKQEIWAVMVLLASCIFRDVRIFRSNIWDTVLSLKRLNTYLTG